jgi:hypothetical protein
MPHKSTSRRTVIEPHKGDKSFAQKIVRELTGPDSHFYVCAKCGERVDKRELRDVIFHETQIISVSCASQESEENPFNRGAGKFAVLFNLDSVRLGDMFIRT